MDKQKVDEYKNRLGTLQKEKQEIDRQLIILEEQYNQYKEKVEQVFKTSDIEELQKIADSYLQDIGLLEGQLNELK